MDKYRSEKVSFAPMHFQQLQPVTYTFGSRSVTVLVPDKNEVAAWYKTISKQGGISPDPYWTQVWPAAIGLCGFLADNIGLIQNKVVLELAAGLALPSLWAATYMKGGWCSDYLPETVALMEKSAQCNGIKNIAFRVLDWNNLPDGLSPEVVLLSDINYEPAAFENLLTVIHRFINAGATVILSTPQRLLAKSFIEQLAALSKQQEEVAVDTVGKRVFVTVFVFCK